ncbi:nuclear transport factor 2 family protein [Prescottella subtropica]|uniref:nuclear transport factor 2 family protein n=1 Tax=Prescottella subtropica TaxID=2545757 RepID=UPI0010F77965|nr:nuclear transport factor 2 family protein [Prescottella subtropica]
MTREPADRLALSDLVAQYAIAVDRRDAAVLAALFTTDARLVQPPALVRRGMDAVLSGASGIASGILGAVAHLHSTRHVVGQQLVELAGDTARGEVYCEAHHVYPSGDGHHDHVVALRYLDEYHRTDGSWRIDRRELIVDFTENRTVALPTNGK